MKTLFFKSTLSRKKIKIIRLEETGSTNNYLIEMSNEGNLAEGSVVVTDNQRQGRGQSGNSWESEAGANLTFSIIFYPVAVKVAEQFVLSKAISLAVYDFLSKYVPDVSVKWPNDVYVGDRKITGILIENFISGEYLNKSVAGIGVNINQEHFISDAPNPVSLRQLTGKIYPLDNCLLSLLTHITNRYQMITNDRNKLDTDYLEHLYLRGKESRFNANGVFFDATITGVNKYGMIEMTTKNGECKSFGFKEVKLVISD